MKEQPSRASSPTPIAFAGISNYRTDSYEPRDTRGAGLTEPTNDYRQVFKTHYAELGKYLAVYLAAAPPNSRSNARSKLTRLTIQHFHELSTDIYDELIRRNKENEAPFLVREDLHPKHNQARQKISILPTSRFEALSSDVFFELARRYPEFNQDPSDGQSSIADSYHEILPDSGYDGSVSLVSSELSAPPSPTIDYLRISKTHYAELGKYLAVYLAAAPPNSRSNARSKLTRLTIHQFHELSTDVCDELIRRNKENEVPLPVREDLHPKHNQARQRLATLPTSRFEDLSSDVLFELARRYPELKEDLCGGQSSRNDPYNDYPPLAYPSSNGVQRTTINGGVSGRVFFDHERRSDSGYGGSISAHKSLINSRMQCSKGLNNGRLSDDTSSGESRGEESLAPCCQPSQDIGVPESEEQECDFRRPGPVPSVTSESMASAGPARAPQRPMPPSSPKNARRSISIRPMDATPMRVR